MKRFISIALTALLLSVFVTVTAMAEATTQKLAFETECLDLDSATVEDSCLDLSLEESSWDIMVAHNTDRSIHSVIFQNFLNDVEIAHLENTTFDQVTAMDIDNASFTTDEIDEPFDSTRVILIRTDLGAVFKLGNVSEDDTGLSFDYELLYSAP